MTIGELLKEYRISQGKKQKEFIDSGTIISQSFYSKVEKNVHKIAADSLVDILHYNNIPVWEFFSRLNQSDEIKHQQIESFNKIMSDAFYDNDKKKVENLKPLIKESNLSEKDKQEELLLVKAWLELMKKNTTKPDIELRKKIKDKIFDIPNFNYNKISLFCNFMKFYDFNSNKIISKKIIEQNISSNSIKIQTAILAIIVNILAFSLKDGKENDTGYFIENGNKIKTRPELVFYKSAFYFFENIVDYSLTKNNASYNKCQNTKDFLANIGMSKYSKVLEQLLAKYN
ncbi:helix-turn-helix domain-containing protein [Lactobacillus gallinarum]|uniref:helix-turn-helix domain-containing protein n=1 Tax=Lactobacillus gallinarum TaxID=52242 RepID=UPI000B3778E2|nr:Rgg/GadR/MutR family transcriptional regulator [Lactobacillus gallinarum]OUP99132.1 transcriptional regulator [Lactobacillus gallinarum]OUQ46176.1 transcriptional regulator [Lactobacillus gallinarum]